MFKGDLLKTNESFKIYHQKTHMYLTLLKKDVEKKRSGSILGKIKGIGKKQGFGKFSPKKMKIKNRKSIQLKKIKFADDYFFCLQGDGNRPECEFVVESKVTKTIDSKMICYIKNKHSETWLAVSRSGPTKNAVSFSKTFDQKNAFHFENISQRESWQANFLNKSMTFLKESTYFLNCFYDPTLSNEELPVDTVSNKINLNSLNLYHKIDLKKLYNYIDYLIQLCKTENLIEESHLDQNFHQVMLTSEGFIDIISTILKEAF